MSIPPPLPPAGDGGELDPSRHQPEALTPVGPLRTGLESINRSVMLQGARAGLAAASSDLVGQRTGQFNTVIYDRSAAVFELMDGFSERVVRDISSENVEAMTLGSRMFAATLINSPELSGPLARGNIAKDALSRHLDDAFDLVNNPDRGAEKSHTVGIISADPAFEGLLFALTNTWAEAAGATNQAVRDGKLTDEQNKAGGLYRYGFSVPMIALAKYLDEEPKQAPVKQQLPAAEAKRQKPGPAKFIELFTKPGILPTQFGISVPGAINIARGSTQQALEQMEPKSPAMVDLHWVALEHLEASVTEYEIKDVEKEFLTKGIEVAVLALGQCGSQTVSEALDSLQTVDRDAMRDHFAEAFSTAHPLVANHKIDRAAFREFLELEEISSLLSSLTKTFDTSGNTLASFDAVRRPKELGGSAAGFYSIIITLANVIKAHVPEPKT